MKVFLGLLLLFIGAFSCGRKASTYTTTSYSPTYTPSPTFTPIPTSTPWRYPIPTPPIVIPPTPWTEAQITTEVQGCVQAAGYQQMLNPEETQRVTMSCRCVFDEASKRWSYNTYTGYPSYYLLDLETSGVVQACAGSL